MKAKKIKITINLEDDGSLSYQEQGARLDQNNMPPPPEINETMVVDSIADEMNGDAPSPPGIDSFHSDSSNKSLLDLAPPPPGMDSSHTVVGDESPKAPAPPPV